MYVCLYVCVEQDNQHYFEVLGELLHVLSLKIQLKQPIPSCGSRSSNGSSNIVLVVVVVVVVMVEVV